MRFWLGQLHLTHFIIFVRCTDMARILVQGRITFSQHDITLCSKFRRQRLPKGSKIGIDANLISVRT